MTDEEAIAVLIAADVWSDYGIDDLRHGGRVGVRLEDLKKVITTARTLPSTAATEPEKS